MRIAFLKNNGKAPQKGGAVGLRKYRSYFKGAVFCKGLFVFNRPGILQKPTAVTQAESFTQVRKRASSGK